MSVGKVCVLIVLLTVGIAVGAGLFGMYRGDINPDTVTSEYSSGKEKVNVPTNVFEVMRQALEQPGESTDDFIWDPEKGGAEYSPSGNGVEGTDEEADTGESEEPSENFGQDKGYWTKKINASPQHSENNLMIAETYGNKEYYIEAQSSGPWITYKALSGSIVKSEGCMLYAAAIAASNKTGKLITVKDIVTGMGFDVIYQSGGYYNTGSKKLPAVGNNPAVGMTMPKALQAGGVSGTDGSSAQDVLNAVKSGEMVVVHENNEKGTGRQLSVSGQHWYVLAGYQDGKYLVLSSNRSKSGWMDAGLVEKSVSTSNHNIIVK